MSDEKTALINKAALGNALRLIGISLSDEVQEAMVQSATQSLARYEKIRRVTIPHDVSPPWHFSALVPGMKVDQERRNFRVSSAPGVRRPENLEDAAFWPVIHLAQLIRTRQVSSAELTQMYLGRLKKYGYVGKLNCVVTLLEGLAMAQARQADAEIGAGRYRGPLHGIPWGVKDLFAVKGYPTTWGAAIYKHQVFDHDATVVEQLRDAGAVLVGKLATAELAAGGDRWFGGQTKNPWNLNEGAAGSSAGSASATAAGLVGFSIGTETSGSIINPSARCGATGLRPTLGRCSRYGAMVLSWTEDRPGPICRYAEDCALVMGAIARPDGRDLSVAHVPFNWDAHFDVRKLRIGYLKEAFDEEASPVARRRNERLLEQIQRLGISLLPVSVPDVMADVSPTDIEAAAFFDEIIRDGRVEQLMNAGRRDRLRSARLVPAVEYLQSQRLRMMLMMKMAEATAEVDVYFGPVSPGGASDNGREASNASGEERWAGGITPPRGIAQRHSILANLASYPALSLPCGWNEAGAPEAAVFYARPFRETELLIFGKAYQDATGFHLTHPALS